MATYIPRVLKLFLEGIRHVNMQSGQVQAAGISEDCAKFVAAGAGATAVYVIARALVNKWQWFQNPSIEYDTIKVMIPAEKEKDFENLLKSKELPREINNTLENIEINLPRILGNELYEHFGKKIRGLIEEVRVENVEDLRKEDASEQTTIANVVVIGGKYTKKDNNAKKFVVVVDTADEKGIIANEVFNDAEVVDESNRGTCVAIKAKTAEEAKETIKAISSTKIRVVISSDLFEDDFIEEFDGSKFIRNVRKELEKARPRDGGYTILGHDGKPMDEDRETVGHAAVLGTTLNWKAIAKM